MTADDTHVPFNFRSRAFGKGRAVPNFKFFTFTFLDTIKMEIWVTPTNFGAKALIKNDSQSEQRRQKCGLFNR